MEAQKGKTGWYEVAEIKLSYSGKAKTSALPKVDCSSRVYEVFLQAWDRDRIEFVEDFKVMLLSRSNRVLGIVNISSGGTAGTVVDIKLVFAAALKAVASSMILAHNHPSGVMMPSDQDIRMTKKLVEVGRMLDVPVLDHLIVSPDGYFSFSDDGRL